MTPATRKKIAALVERHDAMEARSIVPPDTAERDADRSYVERAAEAREYHATVAEALRNHLRENAV